MMKSQRKYPSAKLWHRPVNPLYPHILVSQFPDLVHSFRSLSNRMMYSDNEQIMHAWQNETT